MTIHYLTPEEFAAVVVDMSVAVAAMGKRIDSAIASTSALVERVELVERERDHAVAVADALRARSDRLERELAEALRALVDALTAADANR